MKKISRESLVAGCIGITVLLANSWHILYEWSRNGSGALFTGIAHYFADYFLYVSHIRQGATGAWLFTDNMFTNEVTTPTWIYWVYTLIGKISILGLNPFAAYSLSLFALGALLLFVWWRLIRIILSKYPGTHLIALLLLTTASNFLNRGDFWFSPMPALNRLGGVPHQIFQTVLLLSVVLFFSSILPGTKGGPFPFRATQYFLLVAASFLASTTNPIQMLLVVASGAVTLIWSTGFPISRRAIFAATALALPALLGAYATNGEFARQPILVFAKAWENAQPVSVPVLPFLLALGPIVLLMPLGLRKYLSRLTPLSRMVFVFSMLSLLAFFSPIPKLFGTASVRWLSPASFGLFPILAALGCMELTRILFRILKGKIPTPLLTGLVLAVYMFFTVPSLLSQIEARMEPLRSDPTVRLLNHVPMDVQDALIAIQETPGDGVILTDPALPYDALIPAMTGKRSFTGHPVHTLYPIVKEQLRRKFFDGSMTETQAYAFLTDHGIEQVLASQNASRTIPAYPFLGSSLQNETIIVYAIQPDADAPLTPKQ